MSKATSIYVRRGKTGATDNQTGKPVSAEGVLKRVLDAAGIEEGDEYQIEVALVSSKSQRAKSKESGGE